MPGYDEVIETTDRWRLRIVSDESPPNPRKDYDTCCHVATLSQDRAYAPDPDDGPMQRAARFFYERQYIGRKTSPTWAFVRWVQMNGGKAIEGNDCTVWYLTKEDIAKEDLTDPEATLKAERNEWDLWSNCEVYGYVIEKETTWVKKDDPTSTMVTWECEDSCYGFFGFQNVEEEARAIFATYVNAR